MSEHIDNMPVDAAIFVPWLQRIRERIISVSRPAGIGGMLAELNDMRSPEEREKELNSDMMTRAGCILQIDLICRLRRYSVAGALRSCGNEARVQWLKQNGWLTSTIHVRAEYLL